MGEKFVKLTSPAFTTRCTGVTYFLVTGSKFPCQVRPRAGGAHRDARSGSALALILLKKSST